MISILTSVIAKTSQRFVLDLFNAPREIRYLHCKDAGHKNHQSYSANMVMVKEDITQNGSPDLISSILRLMVIADHVVASSIMGNFMSYSGHIDRDMSYCFYATFYTLTIRERCGRLLNNSIQHHIGYLHHATGHFPPLVSVINTLCSYFSGISIFHFVSSLLKYSAFSQNYRAYSCVSPAMTRLSIYLHPFTHIFG